ncbi:MAG: proliferating cell nuclear antigen, partial [Edafosvirus sp.]
DDDKKNSGGMRIMTVDSTKTVLINLKLEAKQFAEFKCKPAKYEIGISLVQLHKHLKSLGNDDTLTMYIEDDDKQHLVMKIENQEKKSKTDYLLKLMDLDNEPINVPPTIFEAVVTMSSAEFHKICRDMNQIAEYVEIKCLTNTITFTCKGDCSERSTTYYADDNGVNIKHANKEIKGKPNIVQGIYALKNLVLFTKCTNLCNDIQIFMKMNYPLCIKYTVATLGRMLLCLTPIDQSSAQGNYSDDDELYSSDDEKIKLKQEYINEDDDKDGEKDD